MYHFPPLCNLTLLFVDGIGVRAARNCPNIEGTLAGFRTPTFAEGIGVAGFHLHFLRRDKQAGGHALDYRLRAGKVRICKVHDLKIELPTTAEFLGTNFEDPALSQKIKAAEG